MNKKEKGKVDQESPSREDVRRVDGSTEYVMGSENRDAILLTLLETGTSRLVDISEKSKIPLSSVSRATKKLCEQGLVSILNPLSKKNKRASLTTFGLTTAKELMIRNHQSLVAGIMNLLRDDKSAQEELVRDIMVRDILKQKEASDIPEEVIRIAVEKEVQEAKKRAFERSRSFVS